MIIIQLVVDYQSSGFSTRHADSERVSYAHSFFGEASAVNVEAGGGRAHYIDGASEP